jgi:S-DNA-T family DNA segregation ATPase FtsK/SpoIIIE
VKRKAKVKPAPAKKQEELITLEKKKKILGLLLMAAAVILFLSIVTYSAQDSSVGLLNNPDVRINNWVGSAGAIISDFFVRNVLGYFSLVFPFIIFFWGLAYLVKINMRRIFTIFNLLLAGGLIFASFFGSINAFNSAANGNESFIFSGAVGNFIGKFSFGLLKLPGCIIVYSVMLIALMVIAFDFKIEQVLIGFKNILLRSKDKITDTLSLPGDESASDNLKKVKSLRVGKDEKEKDNAQNGTRNKKEFLTADDLMQAEEAEQTKIRIKRRDEEVPKPDASAVSKEKKKKSLKEKPENTEEGLNETEKMPASDEESTGQTDGNELPPEEFPADLPEPWEENINYEPLNFDLLVPQEEENYKVAEEELTHNAQLLKEKLKRFNIDITDIDVTPGPVVTLYEIVPAPGVKISQIVSLEHDIALALAARGLRIIAPIPGKSAIGVEIPNAVSTIVRASSVLSKVRESKCELPIALGKQINGEVYITDLAKMPHLLIAGATGSGKSVGINMIIASLLYSKHPSEVKFMMIDPKKIELSFYKKMRRHYLAISPDLNEDIVTIPQNAVLLLKSVEYEMESRYDKLAKAGVRNIIEYNKKVSDPAKKPKDTDNMKHHFLPYLVVIIDELADLMITAGKEVEEPITRLAQLARAVGIHLVVATQRPSVNVITGVIKANFSARIGYQVATKIDSRTILDRNGAEQLLGKGDMLFLPSDQPKPIRIQNAYISTEEVEKITDVVRNQPAFSKPYFLPSLYDKKKNDAKGGFLGELDPMFEDAARVIVRSQKGSVSLLQRRLKLGYSRAARIVDQLEEAGIVGPNNGSSAREVIVENEEQLETIIRSL